MPSASFDVERVNPKRPGWRRRFVKAGPHRILLQCPPGPRKKGACEVEQIWRRKGQEDNPHIEDALKKLGLEPFKTRKKQRFSQKNGRKIDPFYWLHPQPGEAKGGKEKE